MATAQELADFYTQLAENDNGFKTKENSLVQIGTSCWTDTIHSPTLTSDMSCFKVNPPKPNINWFKVPVDTLVLVKSTINGDEYDRHFVCFMPSREEPFMAFMEKLSQQDAGATTYWQYCRIHPDVEIKDEWLEVKW
jgi:hypothetical protein